MASSSTSAAAAEASGRSSSGTKRKLDEDDGVNAKRRKTDTPEVERCMHCFKGFPLSVLVEHSRRCTGDLSGPRERLKGFLPSIHDLDPKALSVLNETQMKAMQSVVRKSKKASESHLPWLKARVLRLGYTEKDLETTLQWVRQDAPIIIHVNLDSVLQYLVRDTQYRNVFEITKTYHAKRRKWENRIFNGIYARSPPVDRVKYGVLNIVGDPRGVRNCYRYYGDSFLQLKKVRLRTTFASEDTASSSVELSCCEYYANVLYRYTDWELRAILDVATRRKSFLRSDVISYYKEVQIHGPVCLSENVDCIVVNDRHSGDPNIKRLLDVFVERNKCNLIWMEPESEVTYPTFDGYKYTYDENGYDINGYNKEGYDIEGYNKEGYDIKGYDKEGYDKEGFDEDGFDEDGFDEDGFDEDGFDEDGYYGGDSSEDSADDSYEGDSYDGDSYYGYGLGYGLGYGHVYGHGYGHVSGHGYGYMCMYGGCGGDGHGYYADGE